MVSEFESAVAYIKKGLASHPQVALVESEGLVKVVVDDPAGFSVELEDEEFDLTVHAGPYHWHFDDPQEAGETFLSLLTPKSRIVEIRRDDRTLCVHVERELEGKWEGGGSITAFVRLRGTEQTRILQNRVLPGSLNA